MEEVEFAHLEGVTYLDHAGATLYAQSQLDACFRDLSSHLYGNPHSSNPSSRLSSEALEDARKLVLRHFNTDSAQYDIVFTSGCTSALSLLSEIFPWNDSQKMAADQLEITYLDGSKSSSYSTTADMPLTTSNCSRSILCYLEDNHTSVLGMRERAAGYGAQLVCVTEDAVRLNECMEAIEDVSEDLYHLFVYPAQSNFSGCKYPLEWSTQLPNKGASISGLEGVKGKWLVGLDAASYASTNYLDLSQYPVHFVTLSFYKLFGFPTGVGALLIRNDVTHLLKKRYFGGGTVLVSIARERYHQPRPLSHERFEDGTVSFLDIASLRHGFETLTRFNLTMEIISEHTFHLAQLTYRRMKALKHYNDQQLCIFYAKGDYSNRATQGGIVTFNLLRSNGSFIGYNEVDKLACLHNIHIRTGCFCNPGACQYSLGLSCEQIKDNLKAGHTCGDDVDLINGRPTGCVRVSFGYMSTIKDVDTFVDFISTCFIDSKPVTEEETITASHQQQENTTVLTDSLPVADSSCNVLKVGSTVKVFPSVQNSAYILKRLILYPVKSCHGYEVNLWPVSSKGLQWDRQWMIVNERGTCLSQKQEPKLVFIQPVVDQETGALTLTSNSTPSVTVTFTASTDATQSRIRVCDDRNVEVIDAGDVAAGWLYGVLGRKCRLVQMNPQYQREAKQHAAGEGQKVKISLSNEAQYLLLTQSSLHHLHVKLTDTLGIENTPSLDSLTLRFRPNLVLESKGHVITTPFLENDWERLTIGDIAFQVQGSCARCQMICVDQATGLRSVEPLQTLLKLRGSKAGFGIYLSLTS